MAAELIQDSDFLNKHKLSEKAFSRNRKMGFCENIAFILNSLSKTLQIELDDFFQNVLKKSNVQITKQAFSKSRKNIAWEAFWELFALSRNQVLKTDSVKRNNGYRIFAIDASELTIDRTHDIDTFFTSRPNGPDNKNNARISLLTEVIDGFVVDANIGSLQKSERDFAKEHLDFFKDFCDEKDIVIFDRGYSSREMIAKFSEINCKYIMRLQSSTFKGVSDNNSNDFRIVIKHKKEVHSVRIVRVILSTGEIETLATNLDENEFKVTDFRELYAMRWAVETAYNVIKNKLLIEKFSGRTVLTIFQDFFATMFLMNCIVAISVEVNVLLNNEKVLCKYKYKANRNLIIGYLKFRLPFILLQSVKTINRLCNKLIKMCIKQPIPIKLDRSFKRPIFPHQRKVASPKYAI